MGCVIPQGLESTVTSCQTANFFNVPLSLGPRQLESFSLDDGFILRLPPAQKPSPIRRVQRPQHIGQANQTWARILSHSSGVSNGLAAGEIPRQAAIFESAHDEPA
ncbi:hypothetical protein TgHK011_009867 [Trichoderma gracile]|nr:hypothetical protein TgHK011_009867 [Trichoderma gracile]